MECLQINLSLYAVCFTGKGKRIDRFDKEDFSLSVDDDPDVAKRLKAIELTVVALTQSTQPSQPAPAGRQRDQPTAICRN